MKIKKLDRLKGNHDDWFATFTDSEYYPMHWSYGGGATAYSYLKQVGKKKFLTGHYICLIQLLSVK